MHAGKQRSRPNEKENPLTEEPTGKKTHDEEGRRAFILSSLKKSHPPDGGFSDRQFYASFKLAATDKGRLGMARCFIILIYARILDFGKENKPTLCPQVNHKGPKITKASH